MHTGRYARWVIGAVLAAALLAVALLLFVQHQTAPYIYASLDALPTSTAAMVLGASVYQSGILSPVLAARADKAIALYAAGKVSKILVTGDNGDLSHNEVNPTGKYLVEHGIPKGDIFLDHAGFDTYSSMYRARDVFAIRDLIIVSQPFHLSRAVFIARSLGINARGIEASGEPTSYNTLREAPATLKALLDLALDRSPKYLGEQYPIGGDGSPTWADAPLASSTSQGALGTSTPVH